MAIILYCSSFFELLNRLVQHFRGRGKRPVELQSELDKQLEDGAQPHGNGGGAYSKRQEGYRQKWLDWLCPRVGYNTHLAT